MVNLEKIFAKVLVDTKIEPAHFTSQTALSSQNVALLTFNKVTIPLNIHVQHYASVALISHRWHLEQ